MTSGSRGGQITKTENQDKLWLVCPICKNPNPSGTLHCKFCWGPSLYSVAPMTSGELADFQAKFERKQKKIGLIQNLLVYVGAPLLLIMGIVFWLYNFTDVIFAPPAQMNSASFPGESAMYRYDLTRSGSTALSSVTPEGTLKWSFKAAGIILSTPVVVGNTVYIGSNDHYLYALDTATGEVRWKFETGSWVESSPAVVNGIIYFGSNDGKLYALDAVTGYKLWHFDTMRTIKSSPAVADGIVYIGSFDFGFYALDARTGVVIWKYQTGGYVYSSPVIANGIVYVGSNDNSLYAFNARDGRLRLKLTHREVLSSPAVNGDVVYFTSQRYLVGVDGRARNWPAETVIRYWWARLYLARIVPPPPGMTGLLSATRVSYYNTNTSPVYAEGYIYTTGDNRVYQVDGETNKITWTFDTGGYMAASPCLANGVVYAGSQNGRVYAIAAESGTKLWEYETGSPIYGSPTYANGVVYVPSEDGTLYAIK